MTAAALGTLAVVQLVVVAFLVWDHRERRRASPELQAMIDLTDRLCQRIQAPNAAILEHDENARELRSEEYAPPAVTPDDDDAYWLSRDKLAELMMEQESQGPSGRN